MNDEENLDGMFVKLIDFHLMNYPDQYRDHQFTCGCVISELENLSNEQLDELSKYMKKKSRDILKYKRIIRDDI